MYKLILCEMKKFFKNKIIICSLAILIALVSILVFLIPANKNQTVFDMQVFMLDLFGDLFIIAFFTSISSYVFGLELDCKTLKIIKPKDISEVKVYLAKFITGFNYCFVVLAIMFVEPFFNVSRLKIETMTYVNNIHTITESFNITLRLYLNQLFGCIFILSLVLIIVIITQNKIMPVVVMPIFSLVSDFLVASRSLGYEKLVLMLPINSHNIYSEYKYNTTNIRLICLLIYSVILILTGIYTYRKKEVRN